MKLTTKEKTRRTVEVLNAGANRGARENLAAFERWNRESTAIALVPRYIDPVLGRAERMKAEALSRGIPAAAVESTIEAVVSGKEEQGKPVILNLDRPEAIARTILATENIGSPLLGYLLLRLPSGEFWGVRFFLRANDLESRRLGVKFFARLGELTARRGSAAIIGEGGNVATRALEPRYRQWFASHTHDNLGKLLAGVEGIGETFEVTDDGATTYPLVIHENEAWSDPRALAESLAASPPVPILRGERFVIAEISPEGVRFHKVSRRTVDDKVALHGFGVIDVSSIDFERAAREAAQALARAERQTITRRSPVLSTD